MLHRTRGIELTRHVVDAARKAHPSFLVLGTAAISFDVPAQPRPVLSVGETRSRVPDNHKSLGHQITAKEIVKRREHLAFCQIAGGSEYDDRLGIRAA